MPHAEKGEDGLAQTWVLRQPCGVAVGALAWDPRGVDLAATTANGELLVFNIGARIQVHALQVFTVGATPVAWSPAGDVLVVSGNEATYVLKHNSYELVYTLPTASQAFSFSPNSRFLAVSASDSASVTIFDFATRDVSVVPPLPLAITAAVAGGGSSSVDNDTLTQHATADVVSNAWTDDGRFVLVADSLGCIRTSDTSDILLNYGSPITLHTLSFPFLSSSVTKEDDAVVASDAAEERQVDLVAVGSSGYVDREAKEEEDEDGAGEFNLAATKAQHGFEDGADGLRTLGPERIGPSDQGVDIELVEKIVNDKLRDANNDALKLVKARLGLIEPQAPFQSGSTEDTSKKQTRRYLCWNAIGTVSFFRSGSDDTFVEVRFTDTSLGAVRRIQDQSFTMAALGRGGCVFGSPFISETSPGAVYFKAHGESEAAASLVDWQYNLPVDSIRSRRATRGGDVDDDDDETLGESPVSVSIGDGWVAVATDRDLVRFVRNGGAQDAIVAVAGAIVTTAAHGALFAVAYHRSMPTHSRQRMCVDLFEYSAVVGAGTTGQPRLLASADLPLGPNTTLQWLSFSDAGMLVAHSSQGMLLALHAGLGWRWTPILDTRIEAAKQAGNTLSAYPAYWPVAVKGNDLIAAFTKGKGAQPVVATPAPITDTLKFQSPVMADHVGSATIVDQVYIASELARLHRSWLSAAGLSATGSYAPIAIARTSANAAMRGASISDALSLLAAGRAAEASEDNAQNREGDKNTLRAFSKAVDERRDARAASLAGRLLAAKSFTVAEKIANQGQRRGLAELVGSLGTLLTQDSQVVAQPLSEIESAPLPSRGFGLGAGASRAAAPLVTPEAVTSHPAVSRVAASEPVANPAASNPFKRTRSEAQPSLEVLGSSPQRVTRRK